MARLTAAEFQDKHARRLKAAVEDVRKGIDKVTESPTDKAAAQQDKMLTRLTAAVQAGKWAQGLRRVSLEDWKKKARDIGVNRIAAGIDAAKDKVTAFAEQLLPYIDRQKAAIQNMPSVTLDDNINRMNTFIRGMAQFRRTA
jgi:protein-disulfide isomerase-like protein with CxxC motif